MPAKPTRGIKAQTAGASRVAVAASARTHSTHEAQQERESREKGNENQERLRPTYGRLLPWPKEKKVERFRNRCREKVGVFVKQKKSIEAKALSPSYRSTTATVKSPSSSLPGGSPRSPEPAAEQPGLDSLSSSLLDLATEAHTKRNRPETTHAERKFAANLRQDRDLWLDQGSG